MFRLIDNFSWYPVFFPIEESILVEKGDWLKINIWRCARDVDAKRWYEWRVTHPRSGRLHNASGRAYTIGSNS